MLQPTLRLSSRSHCHEHEQSSRAVGRANVLASLVMLAAAGCAGERAPAAQMSVARSAVAEAQRNDAADRSPQVFAAAQGKLARAESAFTAGKNSDARRLAEEATSDARLATTEARTAAAKDALNQATSGATTPPGNR